MALPNVLQTAKSGMDAAKSAIATAGHNISNANTEGYSRQRVDVEAKDPYPTKGSKALIGQGVDTTRISRVNDHYIEKQIRNNNGELSFLEEKDVLLQQVEDVFNELDGEGFNRIITNFFNNFRKLANDPNSEALRQSVQESSKSMVNNFHRLRNEVNEVKRHIDSKIEGSVREVNSLGKEIKNLNLKIQKTRISGVEPNDLLDKRDLALKKLRSYVDISSFEKPEGSVVINLKNVGPFVVGPDVEKIEVFRSPKDNQGKPEGAFDLVTQNSGNTVITHQLEGGRLGALLEARDSTLDKVINRLDELAFGVSRSVNHVHRHGVTRDGVRGISFFKHINQKERAAEFIEVSSEVLGSTNNIATALQYDSPGDNRVALAISQIQSQKIMNNGHATLDDWFNATVSDVGVQRANVRNELEQQKGIVNQLNKIREQISGVSIDEETANLLQYQHAFDASAKVIQVADQMLDTVLNLME